MNISISEHFSYKKLFKFVWPSIIMMIFIAIYSIVDGYFVSNYAGETQFAAINFIFPFIMMLTSVGFMIGTGGSALVGKTLGEQSKRKADELFTMFCTVAIVLGFFLFFLGYFLVRPIASLMGAEGDLLYYSEIYGKILCFGCVPQMLHFLFEPFLVTAEKPKLGLVTTVLAGLTNIFLDYLFVGVFRWGIVGAGVATVIGQSVGGFSPLLFFMSKRNDSTLHLCKFKMDYVSLFKACGNGISELLSNISMSLSGILFNVQIMKFFGEGGVSAYGIIQYVNFIFISAFIGYSIGTSPIISYHYGAKNNDELHSILKKSLIIISVTSIAMFFISFVFADPVSRLFIGYDIELVKFTVEALDIYSVTYLFIGYCIYASDFFTSLNDGITSAIISFLRLVVFEIGLLFLLPYLFGGETIFLVTAVACFLADIVSLAFILVYKKKYGY